jgi:hypothetical protein
MNFRRSFVSDEARSESYDSGDNPRIDRVQLSRGLSSKEW